MSRQRSPHSSTRFLQIAAGLGVIMVVAAGCSSTTKTTTPPTTVAATTTTLAAPTTTAAATSTTAAASTTSAAPSTTGATTTTSVPDTTSAATVSSASVSTDTPGSDDTSNSPDSVWAKTAVEHRGDNGKTFTIKCTPNGTPGTIWGTETYTDDSSICTAAVQVGLITIKDGGSVDYQIAPGLDSYPGMLGHDITSEAYGSWSGSFIFPKAPPGSGTFTTSVASWTINATGQRGQNGKKIAVICSAKGDLGSVYGVHVYTDDSSVCTAAVFEGLITQDKGGTVVIEIAPGQATYDAATANGVTTNAFGSWDGSYTFPKDQTPPTS